MSMATPGPKAGRGCWTEPGACSALCQLILQDWPIRDRLHQEVRRRAPLPMSVYRHHIAPFLRIEAPLPGMLYAFGGRNRRVGPLESVEMLDTWHGVWVPCPPMPRRRAGSAAAPLLAGSIMVLGGYDERGIVEGLLASCDVFDPIKELWTKDGCANMMRARWGHGACSLNGFVYAVGGCSLRAHATPVESSMETLRSCECYDPVQNRWGPINPMFVPRSGCRAVTLCNKYVAAVGGCDDVFGQALTQASVELFDVVTRQWTLLQESLASPRTSAAVSALDDENILVAGGAPSHSHSEIFRVLVREVEVKKASPVQLKSPGMPERRMGCQATVLELPRRCFSKLQQEPPVVLRTQATISDSEEEPPVAELVENEGHSPTGPRWEDQVAAAKAQPSQGFRRCVLVVGGECQDPDPAGHPSRVLQLNSCAGLDLETFSWLDTTFMPQMQTPRTTMALCQGHGRVAPLR